MGRSSADESGRTASGARPLRVAWIVGVLLALLSTSFVIAPTARAGSDSIKPWLDRGAGTVVVPGGTYEGATTKVRRSRPLVLVADERVVVNGTLKFGGASNVTLRGNFVVNGGVHIRSSDKITLDGIEITNRNVGTIKPHSVGVLINLDFNNPAPSRDIVVKDSYVHDTYDDAFRIGHSENVLLQNNRTERIFDVPGNTCAGGTKCHDDGLQVMRASGLRVIDNDFAANAMIAGDGGPIDIVEFRGNQVRDDHHYGINIVQRDAARPVRVAITGENWSYNHKHGPLRLSGNPHVTGAELIRDHPPAAAPPPPPAPSPAPAPQPDPATGAEEASPPQPDPGSSSSPPSESTASVPTTTEPPPSTGKSAGPASGKSTRPSQDSSDNGAHGGDEKAPSPTATPSDDPAEGSSGPKGEPPRRAERRRSLLGTVAFDLVAAIVTDKGSSSGPGRFGAAYRRAIVLAAVTVGSCGQPSLSGSVGPLSQVLPCGHRRVPEPADGGIRG